MRMYRLRNRTIALPHLVQERVCGDLDQALRRCRVPVLADAEGGCRTSYQEFYEKACLLYRRWRERREHDPSCRRRYVPHLYWYFV